MAIPSTAKRLRPRTYSIALYLVGLVLLVQLAMMTIAVVLRVNQVHIQLEAPKLVRKTPLATPSDPRVSPAENGRGRLLLPNQRTAASTPAPASATPSTSEGETSGTPVALLPKEPSSERGPGATSGSTSKETAAAGVDSAASSAPAPPTVVTPKDDIAALLAEAKRLRDGGSLELALRSLQSAEELDPKNPRVLMALAQIHQKNESNKEATGYYQRLVDLGEGSAGQFAAQARAELGILQARLRDQPEIGPNQKLGILPPQKRMLPGTENDFEMLITIVKGPAADSIQPAKVTVQLFFYERLRDGTIEPALEMPQVSFQDSEVNWAAANGSREVLVARYSLPKDKAEQTGREYYGYLLRIAYDGKLQEERGEPANLLNLYEPAS